MSNAIDPEVAKTFCDTCRWTLTVWRVRRALFDDNPDDDALRNPYLGTIFTQIAYISHEYSLMQILKLHDQDKGSLTIDYVLNNGHWEPTVQANLDGLARRMAPLVVSIKPARNKILAHNDIKTYLSNDVLGHFPDGEDRLYFQYLEEFAETVSQTVFGRPFVSDNLFVSDVASMTKLLRLGMKSMQASRG